MMLRVQEVRKVFNRGKANELLALDDVSLDVEEKDFVVIVGANGSGKTTLLNLVAGNILPTSGSVMLDGHDLSRMPDYRRSEWIARVFQNPLSGTAPDLSILDNFRLAALRTQPKGLRIGVNEKFRARVRENIASLGMGLEDKIDQPMGTLSGGQRQALTLLMGVMDKCRLLLLDEPTAALDPRSAQVVMQTADQLIKKFSLTAILVTHNLRDAHAYGNRILQMEEGHILKDIRGRERAELKQNELFEWFV